MKNLAPFAALAGAALLLAACGSSDDASTEANADTVEMPADEALAIGLLQALVPADGGGDHFDAWIRRFSSMPRAGLVAAKRAIVDGGRMPLTEGLRFEQAQFRDLVARR